MEKVYIVERCLYWKGKPIEICKNISCHSNLENAKDRLFIERVNLCKEIGIDIYEHKPDGTYVYDVNETEEDIRIYQIGTSNELSFSIVEMNIE